MQRHYSKYHKFILVMQPTTLNYQLHSKLGEKITCLFIFILFLKEFKEDNDLTTTAYYTQIASLLDLSSPTFPLATDTLVLLLCYLHGHPVKESGCSYLKNPLDLLES